MGPTNDKGGIMSKRFAAEQAKKQTDRINSKSEHQSSGESESEDYSNTRNRGSKAAGKMKATVEDEKESPSPTTKQIETMTGQALSKPDPEEATESQEIPYMGSGTILEASLSMTEYNNLSTRHRQILEEQRTGQMPFAFPSLEHLRRAKEDAYHAKMAARTPRVRPRDPAGDEPVPKAEPDEPESSARAAKRRRKSWS